MKIKLSKSQWENIGKTAGWIGGREHLQYKGKDGRYYSDIKSLDEANDRWKREHLQYK